MKAGSEAALIVLATIALCAAMSVASAVFAPLAFALLIIAILWPLQSSLQAAVPRLVALCLTLVVLLAVFSVLGGLIAWSSSRAAQAIANDAERYQSLFNRFTAWLNDHGIVTSGLWEEHINVGWYVRLLHSTLSRINSAASFWLIVLVYVALGLLEVDDYARNISAMRNTEAARVLLDGSARTAEKFRTYYLVRTLMSVITGLLVFVVTYAVGLPLAKEWGVLAFVLNYIPFLGPLIATAFPTLYAAAEFQSWEVPLLMFVLLNVVQIAIGSYVEPRISGKILSISPLVVLFSVFFWSYLWGIFGAFIGVPISIALITFCDRCESTRWIADLFGGGGGRGSSSGRHQYL